MQILKNTLFDTVTPDTEGNYLYNGSIFSLKIYTPAGADLSSWSEVTEEEKAQIEEEKAQIEEEKTRLEEEKAAEAADISAE